MATTLERIILNELDETTVEKDNADSSNVVYIPGLYGVTYVATSASGEPLEQSDSNYAYVGAIYTNIVNKKSWICANVATQTIGGVLTYIYTWTQLSQFVAPLFTVYTDFERTKIDVTATENAIPTTFTWYAPVRINTETELISSVGYRTLFSYAGYSCACSLEMAHNLILCGLPVLYHSAMKYEAMEGAAQVYKMVATDAEVWSALNAITLDNSPFGAIKSNAEYDVKFITSGVYSAGAVDATQNPAAIKYPYIMTNMLNATYSRKDAEAVIDSGAGDSIGAKSMYNVLKAGGKVAHGEFGGAFAPWAYYKGETGDILALPPSYAYLRNYADAVSSNGDCLAIAGSTRGRLSNLIRFLIPAGENMTVALGNSWQSKDDVVNVNPIVYYNDIGYCIFGARTLYDNSVNGGLTDSSLLNIRTMMCGIKKGFLKICPELLFEPNSNTLWNNFLFRALPILDSFKSKQGLSDYKVVKQATKDKTVLAARVELVTIKPCEQIRITIALKNDGEVAVD